VEERKVDIAIIGSGTSGLNAVGKVKPSGKSFVLINGGEAGTTCARVGCMPSKAMIQLAEDFHRRGLFNRMGIEKHEDMQLNVKESMEYVRDLRDSFVDRVLSNSTDNMPEHIFLEQYARFIEMGLLELDDGQRIRADKIIIATGSTPIIPSDWNEFRDDIITTDEIFEMETLPESAAVIGLGVIGLEIGQSLSRMGVDITGFDNAEFIGGITDPDVNKAAIQTISREFVLHLGSIANISRNDDGKIVVTAGENSQVVDKVFLSIGRRPNLDKLGLENLDIELQDNGIPVHDRNTMQVGNHPLFVAGDMNGERPILHEAGDEGKIAGFNASSETITAFKRKTPLAIVFSDPNIVSVGQRYEQLDQDKTVIGEVPIAPVGRALIMGKNRGLIRVYADKKTGKIIGSEMVTTTGEHLAHLMAWSIQQEMTVGEMLQMPFYHPVMEEALQAALNSAYSKVDMKNASPITELQPL